MKTNKDIKSKFDLIPSPFTLAILLTFISFLLAFFFTGNGETAIQKTINLLLFWQKGFWGLLKFAMQMVLMLVLGSMIARTKAFNKLILKVMPLMKDSASAAMWVALLSILTAYLNWGLGLIFGALLAKKVGDNAARKGLKLNYPLIGAAAYSGLMIWHGGLSGSAPLKVAEQGHFLQALTGIIPVSQSIFSTMNIVLFFLVIVFLPALFFLMGKRKNGDELVPDENSESQAESLAVDSIDKKYPFGIAIGIFMASATVISFYKGSISLNINTINLILFFTALLLYGNTAAFTKAATQSVSSTTGIILQFPFYAGIMGIMKYSGLTDIFTNFFMDISTQSTFPFFTMISAGIVNFFVPSGGGQWAVQGPVVMQAALHLGIAPGKAVMALAYGDQLTNMVQPFWALPLLAITGLKARQILPYTFKIMLAGFVLFSFVLLIF